jgi:hypothetical protein
MNSRDFLQYAYFSIFILSVFILAVMWRRRSLASFYALSIYLAVDIANVMVAIPILFFRKYTGLPVLMAYQVYFYSTYAFFAVESLLLILVVYSVFHRAMEPLMGLHRIGHCFPMGRRGLGYSFVLYRIRACSFSRTP